MITYNNIVTKFQEFVDNHYFLQTFTHGSPADVDLDKFGDFPLLHLVYVGGNYVNNVKTYNLEVYILDNPVRDTDKTREQKSVISATEQAAEDILADIQNGGNIFQFGYQYEIQSANINPLENKSTNLLAGSLLTLSIGVAYTYDSCNAPLSGVEPEGSVPQPYVTRGLLRVREVDGTPDVTSVATMVVPNDSLTDDGNGQITLTFGGGGDADTAEKVHFPVRNDEGATIAAGTPLYSRGEIGGSERILVGIADASDPTKMPAIGIAETELTTNGATKDGFSIMTGTYNTNLSGFTGLEENDVLYVESGGGLTKTKPVGTDLIQNVGIVLKTNGTICQGLKVSCIGRTNDVPNLPDGKFFIGSATNTQTSAYGLPTSDPSDGQTLVYNSANDAFEAGYPTSAGATSRFKINVDATYSKNYPITGSNQLLTVKWGDFLGGSADFDSSFYRAGWNAGTNFDQTIVQIAPFAIGSTYQITAKFYLQAPAGFLLLYVPDGTGILDQVGGTSGVYTGENSKSSLITWQGTAETSNIWALANTLQFKLTLPAGSGNVVWYPESFTIDITHA